MFKINSYSLFLLSFHLLHNPSILSSSFWPPEQSLPFEPYQDNRRDISTSPILLFKNITTPPPFNWRNVSPVAPLMLSGSEHNVSTFNINNPPSSIIESDTTNTSTNLNNNSILSVLPSIEQEAEPSNDTYQNPEEAVSVDPLMLSRSQHNVPPNPPLPIIDDTTNTSTNLDNNSTLSVLPSIEQQEVFNETNDVATIALEQDFFPNQYSENIVSIPSPSRSHLTLQSVSWSNSSESTFMTYEDYLDATNTSVYTNNYYADPNQEDKIDEDDDDHVMTENQKPKKEKKIYKCLTCGKELANLSAFNYHVKTHDPNRVKPWKCDICNKTFTVKSSLKSHLKLHNNPKPAKKKQENENKRTYECSECGKKLASRSSFEYHVETHNPNRAKDRCHLCNKTFTTKYSLKNHIEIHNKKKPEKKKRKLKNKKKKQENENKRTYECSECGKELATQNSYNYHIKTHDKNRQRPWKCHLCDKSFAVKDILTAHIKRHNKGKPFKCDFCSKCFKEKQEKDQHHRTHTKEKPYKCTFCSKSFATQTMLKQHNRTHTGEKPFECGQCNKSFTRKASLQSHVRSIHNGESPFKCDICGKGISSSHALKNHLNKHKGIKPFKCTQCPESFRRKNALNAHIGKEHYKNAYVQ